MSSKKVWLITGASRGFGEKIAAAALARGDSVIATARDPKSLKLGNSPFLLGVKMDVTDEAQINAAVKAGVEKFGRIDVLVNNAGYGLCGAVEESSAEEVKRLYETNVFGLLNVTRSVLPQMRKQRSGHILNLSSVGGYRSGTGFGIYCSTKFAIEGLSEALYEELAPLNINVTIVEPGYFRTDFLESSSLVTAKQRFADYDETAGKVRTRAKEVSLKQPGDPEKLAQALLKIVDSKHPPLRLAMGTDTLQAIAEKNAFVEQELEEWRELSASTNY